MDDQIDQILSRLTTERVDNSGNLPIPSLVDDDTAQLVDAYQASSKHERQKLVSQLNASADFNGFLFTSFAERMAARAVRENDARWIESGFVALKIASQMIDVREAFLVVNLLYRSCEILRLESHSLFQTQLCNDGSPLDQFLSAFHTRSQKDRSIKAMGYLETIDMGGFRYQRSW